MLRFEGHMVLVASIRLRIVAPKWPQRPSKLVSVAVFQYTFVYKNERRWNLAHGLQVLTLDLVHLFL